MRTDYDFTNGVRGKFFHRNAKLKPPTRDAASDWAGPEGDLGDFITEESRKIIRAYKEQPRLVLEHANTEHDTARGGYANRQLFELVQNGADALSASDGGRIAIRLTDGCLYCADDGAPISRDGVTALMHSHMSPKRGTGEIGRFGLGFKSVLGVTDAPEFFSRAGSFRFDRELAQKRVQEVIPDADRCPTLRVAAPVHPYEARDADPVLCELMDWAMNIVRLPLKDGKADSLRQQMRDFPSEFLLFVKHVRHLTLHDGSALDRVLELENTDGMVRLIDGDTESDWKLFSVVHRLSSEARHDGRSLDDEDEAPIWWAAPVDRLDEPGHFWAFFPTETASLVAGILNAPWKTNEDRHSLLPGPYNEELIEAAAQMVARHLPELATPDEPARHLDALPRRREAGDSSQIDQLRKHLFTSLCDRAVMPDQDGTLCSIPSINYPPKELVTEKLGAEALDRWAEYSGRPRNWLHRRALPRNRIARVESLIAQWKSVNGPPAHHQPNASIRVWLEALVTSKTGDAAVAASRAALLTAAVIPDHLRRRHPLGDIVLMQNGDWRSVDPEHVFLPSDATGPGSSSNPDELVHPDLANDADARCVLKGLGINPVSAESHFNHVASELLWNGSASDDEWRRFWTLSRDVDLPQAKKIIKEPPYWRAHLRVRTQNGAWAPIHRALLPGCIVPGPNGRDRQAAIDLEFHHADKELLDYLGAVSEPEAERALSAESWFRSFERESRAEFKARKLPRQPNGDYLKFISTRGAGPLDVLEVLSNDGRAEYTNVLFDLDSVFRQWTMRHTTRRDYYPDLAVDSPATRLLRRNGRLRTPSGIVPLADALGTPPKNSEARRALLAHRNADGIRTVFDLAEPEPEFFGEEDPIPLNDVWPGFQPVTKFDASNIDVVYCERILASGDERDCLRHASNIYLRRALDSNRQLMCVLQLLEAAGVWADVSKISEDILRYSPPPTVDEKRAAVREWPTDAERLLKAVGESALRRRLPESLLAILESDNAPLNGVTIAKAAIATHHTGALRYHRDALHHLNPPAQWAGSSRAVDFVQSLGFSSEWAGDRDVKRPPFVEVEGPYSLPDLHDYQNTIVNHVRNMLRDVVNGQTDGSADETRNVLRRQSANSHHRRGMISLPTGSGKTRVAVQAIVEAMRYDGFRGNILWVADRDELCEQAVEAWRQVWSAIGAQETRLRISRLWAGQPAPWRTSDRHVVVATIQTLNARLKNRRSGYGLLTEFTLIVFDEAHRSIAPTFTSVMQETGLTHRQKEDEPFLIGLTATPYRGHDEEETGRLVKRYGRQRLDAGAFPSDNPEDVVSELQNMHVLALADHQTIDGGDFSLNDDELGEMNRETRPPWLPRSVEERIARDSARTNRILDACETQVRRVDPGWPVLIFATSVEHAQTVAALLSTRGVASRAVSGTTEASTRRRVVEDFRRGDLKVLVNYGVFREGFDAPRTRVIIVARPVYSPNLYFQMIGRGLRGPKNGGTDRCLIINVQDNIDNFERKLAFSDLDWLWA